MRDAGPEVLICDWCTFKRRAKCFVRRVDNGKLVPVCRKHGKHPVRKCSDPIPLSEGWGEWIVGMIHES